MRILLSSVLAFSKICILVFSSFLELLGDEVALSIETKLIFLKDYFMLCGLRFERWFRCDLVYHDLRHTKFDHVKNQKNYKTYPCYREYYEAQYAC